MLNASLLFLRDVLRVPRCYWFGNTFCCFYLPCTCTSIYVWICLWSMTFESNVFVYIFISISALGVKTTPAGYDLHQSLNWQNKMCAYIKICSLNARGLSDYKKKRDLFHYLHNKQYSIVCLQETHFTQTQENFIEAEWGYRCFFSSLNSLSRGTVILFKNNFQFQIHNMVSDPQGNYMILNVTIENKQITLVCLYGPNRDNPDFFKKVQCMVEKEGNQNIIIVGDWMSY